MTATFKEMKGSIFDSLTEVLVNPVNCVGVMGAGLALQFKQRFPENYTDYKHKYKLQTLYPGRTYFFKEQNKIICNFCTKVHWKDNSKLRDIEIGLSNLKNEIEINKIKSVAIPAIGCGLGNLDWEEVRTLIVNTLQDTNCTIELYPPK